MDLEAFTPWFSLAGGLLIGIASTLLLVFNGRVAGISGIYGAALTGSEPLSRGAWRWAFVAGLVGAGALMVPLAPELFAVATDRAPWMFAAAGLLVGLGTRLGNGCTSGHGVCGMSRMSRRSLVATAVFISTGALTVYLARTLGGAS